MTDFYPKSYIEKRIEDGFEEYSKIPERMKPGIRRYILDGVIPGHFLSAIVCNDLFDAFGRADDENVKIIEDYIRFFYNYPPSGCYGSEERVRAWMKDGGANGREEKMRAAGELEEGT